MSSHSDPIKVTAVTGKLPQVAQAASPSLLIDKLKPQIDKLENNDPIIHSAIPLPIHNVSPQINHASTPSGKHFPSDKITYILTSKGMDSLQVMQALEMLRELWQ